jgi:FAD/FMN-containing dehydrogenase
LATTGGVIPATGIAGLTLGGGLGWTMRKFGLSCDNLLSADIVTADGRFLTASESENAELFWGLRGGGGNFGVVTSLEYRLHQVGPLVLFGPVFHPLAAGRDALRFYRDIAPTLPDEMRCDVGLLTSPEGAALAAMVPAFIGPVEAGEAAIQPIRAYGSPVADMVSAMPYRTVQTFFNAAFPDGRRNYWKSAFLPSLDDDAIDLMVEGYATAPSASAFVYLEQCGGAVNRIPSDKTAFPHRSAAFNLMVLSAWDDPSEDERNLAWVREVWASLRPFIGDGVYVNYLSEQRHEGENRVKAAYGANYDRLSALKRNYDPTNLFRHNQNISPAAS